MATPEDVTCMVLVPLLLGFATLVGVAIAVKKGMVTNRPMLGTAVILSSLLFWASTAVMLVYEQDFYPVFDVLTVFLFFFGVAAFFPPPDNAAPSHPEANYSMLAFGIPNFQPFYIVIGIGLNLGFAHMLALRYTAWWPTRLLEFYASLGFPAQLPIP